MLILLDRDGVLNEVVEGGYVTHPEDFRWLPGAREALRLLLKSRVPCAIVTNQAAIAKGLATEAEVRALHDWMLAGVRNATDSMPPVYTCPHRDEDDCLCRKPKPGLLIEALRVAQTDPDDAIFVGDTLRDAIAAQRARVRFFLVHSGLGWREEPIIRRLNVPIAGVFANLDAVCRALLAARLDHTGS